MYIPSGYPIYANFMNSKPSDNNLYRVGHSNSQLIHFLVHFRYLDVKNHASFTKIFKPTPTQPNSLSLYQFNIHYLSKTLASIGLDLQYQSLNQ